MPLHNQDMSSGGLSVPVVAKTGQVPGTAAAKMREAVNPKAYEAARL